MNEKLLHALLAKDVMTAHLIRLAPLIPSKTHYGYSEPTISMRCRWWKATGRLVGILTTHDLIRTMEKMLVLEHYHPV